MKKGKKDLEKIEDKELVEYNDPLLDIIISKTGLPTKFKTLGKKELMEIANDMPAVYRNMEVYGRKNSQVTGKMMTLSMLIHGPWNAIRQCDAQINTKKNAIEENRFKLMRSENKLKKLENKFKDENLDEFQRRETEISIAKTKSQLANVQVYLEHSLKEIKMYQESKKEIMATHNITENFTEAEFIEAEVKENIQTAYQHLIRDIQMTGHPGMGTLEWLEQFGILPEIAFAEVIAYLQTERHDIRDRYKFYDAMYEKHKNDYIMAMERLGIKNLVTDSIAYKGNDYVQIKEACIICKLTFEKYQEMSRRQLTWHYKKLAKETHPDRGGDKELFIEMKLAYEYLWKEKGKINNEEEN